MYEVHPGSFHFLITLIILLYLNPDNFLIEQASALKFASSSH